MAAWDIAVLLAIAVGTSVVLGTSPTIGLAYYHGTVKSQSAPVSESGSVRIQSTSTASQTPPCNSDDSCQSLCPTEDITAQQPALSTTTVQQQVISAYLALQHRADLPV